jgi:hypothetical protein
MRGPASEWARVEGPTRRTPGRIAVLAAASVILVSQIVIVGPPRALALSLVVNSTGDEADLIAGDGECDTGALNSEGATECTLRAAIQEANASAGADLISFNIPPTELGFYVIQPQPDLPPITDTVTIDATTQPGFAGSPVVVIDGGAPGSGDGIWLVASASTIRGLVVQNFGDDAITVDGNDNVIAGNYVGVDVTGTVAAGNGGDGILVRGNSNTIGGTGPGDRNVVSGNGDDGVSIDGGNNNVVIGNFIGTNASGNTAIANADHGVAVQFGATGNTIGGQAPNLISGNAHAGVLVRSTGTNGTVIRGNYIGVNAAGTAAVGNGNNGVLVQNSASNTVIGVPGDGNVISGNFPNGIGVYANGVTIQGNLIGTNAGGNGPIPNADDGIDTESGATGLMIGGLAPGAGNTIAYNIDNGVVFRWAGNAGAVVSNSIHSNGGLGIDLFPAGVTANDPFDSDSGANGLLNFPVITGATEAGGTITVHFDLDVPAGNYRIEFFANPSGADPSGYGEGEVLAGSATVGHAGAGAQSYQVSFPAAGGSWLTATTTRCTAADCASFQTTSEFSAAAAIVVSNHAPVLNPVGNRTVDEMSALTFTATASDPDSGDTATFSLSGAPAGAAINPVSGLFTWTPTEAQGPGVYTFSIVVTDSGTPQLADSESIVVTVREVNRPPVIANPGSRSSSEGDAVHLAIVATDPDLPANSLTFSAAGLPPGLAIAPATGLITGNISPDATAASPYLVVVTVTDNGSPILQAQTGFAWVVTGVQPPPNRPPVARDLRVTTAEDTPIEVAVTANDSDPEGAPLTVVAVTAPTRGSVTIVAPDRVRYVPPLNFAGEARFTYTISDGAGGRATATVVVDVFPVNDPPQAADDFYAPSSFLAVSLDLLANDVDPDGDALRIELTSSPQRGAARVEGNAVLFTPQRGWAGMVTFTYEAIDPEGARDEATVTVVISPGVLQAARQSSNDIGTDLLPFGSPRAQFHVAEMGLFSMQAIKLLADAFFQTLQALRLPLSFLGLTVLALIGLGSTGNVPGLLMGTRHRFWSVVLLSPERSLPAYREPGAGEVVYSYEPTASGIVSTGPSVEVGAVEWVPVDTPMGKGWLCRAYLTEQVDLPAFMNDPRPVELVHKFAHRLRDGLDLSPLISERGLVVAMTGPPARIPSEQLRGLLENARLRHLANLGGDLDAQAHFQVAVAHPFLEAYRATKVVTAEVAHSRTSLIPTECWNFPYLALGVGEGVQPWLVFFEYRRGKPWIAGLGIDE